MLLKAYSFLLFFLLFSTVLLLLPVFSLQVDFAGLTGTVKFDKNGLRHDYSIEVLEVSTNRGMAKVSAVNGIDTNA